MAKVLIVYENIPESTEFYIVDAFMRDLDDLKHCADNYLNMEVSDDVQGALERLNWYISDPSLFWKDGELEPQILKDLADVGVNPQHLGKWFTGKISASQLLEVRDYNITHVLVTGYLL